MHILNTTFVVHHSVDSSFVDWVRDVYMPAMQASGVFSDVTVMRVMAEIDPDTVNYAVQARTDRFPEAIKWRDEVSSALRDGIFLKTGEKVLSFSTEMEVVL